MKACVIQISLDALGEMLNLPKGCEVTALVVTREDFQRDAFSIKIEGIGDEVLDGHMVPVMDVLVKSLAVNVIDWSTLKERPQ